jgi:hypothetical protein
MSFMANAITDEDPLAVFVAFHRRRGIISTIAGLLLFAALGTARSESQTPPSIPAPQPTTRVAQPGAVPNAGPADQSSGTPPPEQTGGQQPGDDQGATFVFKKEVREVILHATVVDEQRRLVTDLDRAAFTVFEDGVPQATTSFHREDVPAAMGIVIDNSGSMREKRDKVNQAVLNLIRASDSKDEIFVVNFGQDSQAGCRRFDPGLPLHQ